MSWSLYNQWYHSWLWKDEPNSGYNGRKKMYSGDDMEDAYNAGKEHYEKILLPEKNAHERLIQERDAYKELLAANVRTIKAEIQKEQKEASHV